MVDWNGRRPCRHAQECWETEMNAAAVMKKKFTGLSSEVCGVCFEYSPIKTPLPKWAQAGIPQKDLARE